MEGKIEGQVDIDTVSYPNEKKSIDNKYLCPISQEIMKNPVIAYDGITYEKDNIINYLKEYYKTPKTENKLNSIDDVNEAIDTSLIPDYQVQPEFD